MQGNNLSTNDIMETGPADINKQSRGGGDVQSTVKVQETLTVENKTEGEKSVLVDKAAELAVKSLDKCTDSNSSSTADGLSQSTERTMGNKQCTTSTEENTVDKETGGPKALDGEILLTETISQEMESANSSEEKSVVRKVELDKKSVSQPVELNKVSALTLHEANISENLVLNEENASEKVIMENVGEPVKTTISNESELVKEDTSELDKKNSSDKTLGKEGVSDKGTLSERVPSDKESVTGKAVLDSGMVTLHKKAVSETVQLDKESMSGQVAVDMEFRSKKTFNKERVSEEKEPLKKEVASGKVLSENNVSNKVSMLQNVTLDSESVPSEKINTSDKEPSSSEKVELLKENVPKKETLEKGHASKSVAVDERKLSEKAELDKESTSECKLVDAIKSVSEKPPIMEEHVLEKVILDKESISYNIILDKGIKKETMTSKVTLEKGTKSGEELLIKRSESENITVDKGKMPEPNQENTPGKMDLSMENTFERVTDKENILEQVLIHKNTSVAAAAVIGKCNTLGNTEFNKDSVSQGKENMSQKPALGKQCGSENIALDKKSASEKVALDKEPVFEKTSDKESITEQLITADRGDKESASEKISDEESVKVHLTADKGESEKVPFGKEILSEKALLIKETDSAKTIKGEESEQSSVKKDMPTNSISSGIGSTASTTTKLENKISVPMGTEKKLEPVSIKVLEKTEGNRTKVEPEIKPNQEMKTTEDLAMEISCESDKVMDLDLECDGRVSCARNVSDVSAENVVKEADSLIKEVVEESDSEDIENTESVSENRDTKHLPGKGTGDETVVKKTFSLFRNEAVKSSLLGLEKSISSKEIVLPDKSKASETKMTESVHLDERKLDSEVFKSESTCTIMQLENENSKLMSDKTQNPKIINAEPVPEENNKKPGTENQQFSLEPSGKSENKNRKFVPLESPEKQGIEIVKPGPLQNINLECDSSKLFTLNKNEKSEFELLESVNINKTECPKLDILDKTENPKPNPMDKPKSPEPLTSDQSRKEETQNPKPMSNLEKAESKPPNPESMSKHKKEESEISKQDSADESEKPANVDNRDNPESGIPKKLDLIERAIPKSVTSCEVGKEAENLNLKCTEKDESITEEQKASTPDKTGAVSFNEEENPKFGNPKPVPIVKCKNIQSQDPVSSCKTDVSESESKSIKPTAECAERLAGKSKDIIKHPKPAAADIPESKTSKKVSLNKSEDPKTENPKPTFSHKIDTRESENSTQDSSNYNATPKSEEIKPDESKSEVENPKPAAFDKSEILESENMKPVHDNVELEVESENPKSVSLVEDEKPKSVSLEEREGRKAFSLDEKEIPKSVSLEGGEMPKEVTSKINEPVAEKNPKAIHFDLSGTLRTGNISVGKKLRSKSPKPEEKKSEKDSPKSILLNEIREPETENSEVICLDTEVKKPEEGVDAEEEDDGTQVEILENSQEEGNSQDTYRSEAGMTQMNYGFCVDQEPDSGNVPSISLGELSQDTSELDATNTERDMFATQDDSSAETMQNDSQAETTQNDSEAESEQNVSQSDITQDSSKVGDTLDDSQIDVTQEYSQPDVTQDSTEVDITKKEIQADTAGSSGMVESEDFVKGSQTGSSTLSSEGTETPTRKRKLTSHAAEAVSKLPRIEEKSEADVKSGLSPMKVTIRDEEFNLPAVQQKLAFDSDKGKQKPKFVLVQSEHFAAKSKTNRSSSPDVKEEMPPLKKSRQSIEVIYAHTPTKNTKSVDVVDIESSDSQLDDSQDLCLHLSPSPISKSQDQPKSSSISSRTSNSCTSDNKLTSSYPNQNGDEAEDADELQGRKRKHDVPLIHLSDSESEGPTSPLELPHQKKLKTADTKTEETPTTSSEMDSSAVEQDATQQLLECERKMLVTVRLKYTADNKVVHRQIIQCEEMTDNLWHSFTRRVLDYNSSSSGLADCSSKNPSPSSTTSGPGPFTLQPTRMSLISMLSGSSSSSGGSSVALGALKKKGDDHFAVPTPPKKSAVDSVIEGLEHIMHVMSNLLPEDKTKLEEHLKTSHVMGKETDNIMFPKDKTKLEERLKIPHVMSKEIDSSLPLLKVTPTGPSRTSTKKRKPKESEHIEDKQSLTTTVKEKPPEPSVKSPYNIEECSLKPGLQVYARWTDRKYYSGKVKEKTKDGRWTIMFDDGNLKSLVQDFIIAVKELEKGQSVYAQDEDEEYLSGVITKVEKRRADIIYSVELDEGKTVTVSRSALFMTEDQAKNLREAMTISSPMKTNPQRITDLSLENVLEGKRSRVRSKEVQKVLEPAGVSGVGKSPSKNKATSPVSSDSEVGSVKDSIHGIDPETIEQGKITSGKVKSIGRGNAKKSNLVNTYGPVPAAGSKIFAGKCFLLTHTNIRSYVSESEGTTDATDEQPLPKDYFPFSKSYLTKQIEAGGGTVFNKFEDIPPNKYKNCYLVANKPSRTALYILCLAHGIPIVSNTWVIESCQNKTCAPYSNNALHAGWSMEKKQYVKRLYGQMLRRTKVGLVSNVNVFLKFWKKVLEAAGANVITIPPPRSHEELKELHVVVSDHCPSEIMKQVQELKKPLVNTNWVVECLINGSKCSFKGYE